jgi:hypothetical protein
MSGLALSGWIALAFGVGAYYAVGTFGAFSAANLTLGALALLAAGARALARARGAAAPAFRGALRRGLLGIALTAALGLALERLAAASGVQFDWSFERRFELSPAVRGALSELGMVEATLYGEEYDPRLRSSRVLLRTMEQTRHLRFGERRIGDHPQDEERYGVASSNTVVLERGERFETVQRPTEGTIYEALYRLRGPDAGLLYVARGAGEGDLEAGGPADYSGLAAALQTEGYRLRGFVTAAANEIPEDADALLVIGPRRPLRPEAVEALQRYLRRGGRLVAMLEPGVASGLEALLAQWGLSSPDALVIDPASGSVAGDPPGLNPLAFSYADHPITRGLGPGRMTFFRGARGFELRKPEPDDRISGVVYASGRSWLARDLGIARRAETPARPPDAREDYVPLVAVGSYERGGRETRIVAFGDSELASNQYLRTLYNLDLVLNAVHWAAEREPAITLRPKAGVTARLQLPLPIQNTLTMFQGVGLVLPELLMLAAAFAWARGRT